jgi:MoxR-like ATPase
MDLKDIQKPLTETRFKEELEALAANDGGRKPAGWKISPQAVRTFILGSPRPLKNGGKTVAVGKKFYGDDALVERAIVTLAGNRGLMLVGEPGTAKSMLSELLAAAISDNSANTIQGTAGTSEDSIKYSWNYAMLLAKGPVPEALVPSPVYTGMEQGLITRFEEITRCPLEIQDSLISIMSDRVLHIPEFGEEGTRYARRGFNIIATANTRDRGINEMSSALKRRFNFETVEAVRDAELEGRIIAEQCGSLLEDSGVSMSIQSDVVELLAVTYNELRTGNSFEKAKIQKLNAVMSTAEAVSVYYQSALDGWYYRDGRISVKKLTENLLGAVLKENRDDLPKLKEYFSGAVKLKAERMGGLWKEYYESRNVLR